MADPKIAIERIERGLSKWREYRSRSQYEDCSDQKENDISAMIAMLASLIDRMTPPGDRHKQLVDEAIKASGPNSPFLLTFELSGGRRSRPSVGVNC